MRSVNRIITRGMGASRGKSGRSGMITQGYGGLREVFEEAARHIVKHGKAGVKKVEEIVIWAKLITVNHKTPTEKIEGFVRVPVKTSNVIGTLVEHVSTNVKKTWNRIHINVKFLTRR